MSHHHPSRRVAGAFTLVELLVVIGIIALLISVLLPALNKAREQAKVTQCLSNLRQLGIGMQLYRQANADYYPPRINTYAGIAAPVGTVFNWTGQAGNANSTYKAMTTDQRQINRYMVPTVRPDTQWLVAKCPSDDGAFEKYGSSYSSNHFSGNATNPIYSLVRDNVFVGGVKNNDFPIRGTQVRNSARFVIAGEHPALNNAMSSSALPADLYNYFHVRGKPIWNVLFADGHALPVTVKYYSADPVTGNYTRPAGSGTRYATTEYNFERNQPN